MLPAMLRLLLGLPGRPLARRHRVAVGRTALGAATLLTLVGCGILDPEPTHYVIEVDSVSVPEAVAPDAGFTARFHGIIGPNLCHSLDRVERGRGEDVLRIRFHGVDRQGWGTSCPTAISVLDHEERVEPPVDPPFTIEVLQPDGSTLEEVVREE